MILRETGEYSDYSIRMLGYVKEESKAKEIVEKKNQELKVLFDLKEKYDNFRVQYQEANPFAWKKNDFSFEAEEEEMEKYREWSDKTNQAINNWLIENNIPEETSRQMTFLYGDNYLYKKIEEYEEV